MVITNRFYNFYLSLPKKIFFGRPTFPYYVLYVFFLIRCWLHFLSCTSFLSIFISCWLHYLPVLHELEDHGLRQPARMQAARLRVQVDSRQQLLRAGREPEAQARRHDLPQTGRRGEKTKRKKERKKKEKKEKKKKKAFGSKRRFLVGWKNWGIKNGQMMQAHR